MEWCAKSQPRARRGALLLAAALALGCGDAKRESALRDAGADAGSQAGDGAHGEDARAPFEALGPEVYGSKIKTLMVGQPLSPDELKALRDAPEQLPALIDRWMGEPAWRERLLGFLQQAFQQTQVSAADYNDQFGIKPSAFKPDVQLHFERAAEESFARTVLALLDEGKPFSEVLTTRRFMLNPPLMAALSYMDAVLQDDAGNPVRKSWLLTRWPDLTFTAEADPVPLEESVNPSSPRFLHFQYVPMAKPGCELPVSIKGYAALPTIINLMFGKNPNVCGNGTPLFSEADWDAWQMVEVRAPKTDQERTPFWDLPALRKTRELVLATPRVGFMTTPAFFANWPTNDSNQMRVTMNQTLIVALGTSFDDRDTTTPVTETTSDAAHVEPGTPCYGCHHALDPMRNFFRQSYNSYYSLQTDAKREQIPDEATFTLGMSSVSGNGVGDLAGALAQSELFAAAWTQKLCRLANSASCDTESAEFKRIAQAFRDGGYDFKRLVRDVFSSPLVTFATDSQSAQSGAVIGIQRRETLCNSLSQRLGLKDVCALHGTAGLVGQQAQRARVAGNLAGAIPGDGYTRGSEVPLMPHDPNLFFVSGVDNLCARLATQLVDAGQASKWTSANKDAALDAFVANVMGVSSADERSAPLRGLLAEHYDGALSQGEKPADALRSTFVLACTSPLSVSLGL